ncbi:hypothetical protein GT037_003033 [Alternaria burnsii]|uniref:Uncharacterized protein n=1 Tax=Alternaria burnsii TaxID=1187904 RepID=A0A8H7EHV8_9PLEO|nr:uncharacterized protein GT037_003033 [Alternaria burnsii]KAF7679285.1 hypothetical protein GT037_003033 [Alternaria burnsii]
MVVGNSPSMQCSWWPFIAKPSGSFAWTPGVQGSASLTVLKTSPANNGNTPLMPLVLLTNGPRTSR